MRRRATRSWRELNNSPIRVMDSFIMFSEPATLAGGHPLRSNRCLLCAAMIGGQGCRFVSVVIADNPECTCGQIPTVTQLICVDHGAPEWEANVPAVVKLSLAAHDGHGH